MSFADLTLHGMERYGAVELLENSDRFVARGFIASLLLTVWVFLLYYGISTEEAAIRDRPIIKSLAELAPPPSTRQDIVEPVVIAAPADLARPRFGIPVPVPDAAAVENVMPDLNFPEATPVGEVLHGNFGGSIINAPPTSVPQEMEEGGPDIFQSVDEDPVPIVDLQSLVKYPEVARRSGLEGKVIISVLIDIDGSVLETRIDKADYEVFRQPAIDALMKARFRPAILSGEPIRFWYTVPISFKLSDR